MILAGFQGIGKTSLAQKYQNVIDLDAMPYFFELTKSQENMNYEKLKGREDRKKTSKMARKLYRGYYECDRTI